MAGITETFLQLSVGSLSLLAKRSKKLTFKLLIIFLDYFQSIAGFVIRAHSSIFTVSPEYFSVIFYETHNMRPLNQRGSLSQQVLYLSALHRVLFH